MSRSKRIIFTLGKICISGGLLYLLLRGGQLGRVVSEMGGRFQWQPFWLGIAAFGFSNILGGCQWNILLRAQGINMGYPRAIALYFVGLFFSNFLPANIGGDVVKVLDVYRSTGRGGGVVAATLIDRATGLAMLTIIACIAVGFAYPMIHGEPVILLIPLLLLFFVGFALMIMSPRVASVVMSMVSGIPFEWIRRKGETVLSAIFQYSNRKKALVIALLIALPVQILRIGVHYFAARSINVEGIDNLGLYFFLFVPIIAVAIALPISINGLGVREGFGVYLYGKIGLGHELAFSISLIAYAVGVVVSLIGGCIFLFRSGIKQTPQQPDL